MRGQECAIKAWIGIGNRVQKERRSRIGRCLSNGTFREREHFCLTFHCFSCCCFLKYFQINVNNNVKLTTKKEQDFTPARYNLNVDSREGNRGNDKATWWWKNTLVDSL